MNSETHTNAFIPRAVRPSPPSRPVASRRVASTIVARVTAANQPPPVAPARRHPTADDPSHDVRRRETRTRASKKHIEPIPRAHHAPFLSRDRSRSSTRSWSSSSPSLSSSSSRARNRIEPAASDVTTWRHGATGGRSMVFFVFFDSIFLLIGFGVCPLRTYVVSCIHDES